MAHMTEGELTAAVLSSFDHASDPRTREVVEALVRHLHEFVVEVALTEKEWMDGIRFLTRTGQKCDNKRQEFILLSDVTGVSMLIDLVNNRKKRGATESTVFGPFYVPGAPERTFGESIAVDDPDGEVAVIRGSVRSSRDGHPLPGAVLDVWQTKSDGFYDVQQPEHQPEYNMRGVFTADPEGRYEIRTTRPVSYSIPADGPVGALLRATGRHPWRAAHVHFIVAAPGYVPVTTHLFDAENEHLDDDAVFGVKPDLVAAFVRHDDPGDGFEGAHLSLDFDFVLDPAPEGAPPAGLRSAADLLAGAFGED